MDHLDQTDQDSNESSESSGEDLDAPANCDSNERLEDEESRPSTSRVSTHVTVHRDEILSTNVREGDEELQDLNVDVYDQQTYEKSVFDQVDRAIEQATDVRKQNHDKTAANSQTTKINDLIRLVHGDDEQDRDKNSSAAGETHETDEGEDQVLRLARQARLNRTVIKSEPVEVLSTQLPRIPKIPRRNNTQDVKPTISNLQHQNQVHHKETLGPSTSSRPQLIKSEPRHEIEEGEILSSDDEELSSISSEYKPSASEPDDDDDNEDDLDDVEYGETDSELVNGNDESQEESSIQKLKKMRDDGDFKAYSARIKAYTRERAKVRLNNILDDGTEMEKLDEVLTIEGNLQCPKNIWDNLYDHQKTGVRWLWELHQLGTGGILGDEMGLGKTIQTIAYLVALKTSDIIDSHRGYKSLGPTVLVCPATVMHQWLTEFRKWYPPFRVAILHSTGSFSGDRKQLIKVIHKSNGILICSFPGVIIYQDQLHDFDWHYVILDEGHKIRNPDAQVTLACKRFRTPHRIILSGSPVQNNLRELWSIFDFIYPGKLGTLPVFMSQFSIPITQGGYANATDIQVQIAYKCACVLRDTIKPFLLRRTKAEVNSKLKLPERSEQVLFCKLTEQQRKMYQHYLDSPTVRDIKRGVCQIFVGLIQLRKICNHPDLFDASECNRQVKQTKLHQEKRLKHLEYFSVDETYGHCEKSGKMMVVDALLKLWKKQGHKVLLFTQSRLMLKIFTNYLNEREYKYLIMDGSTPIGVRHTMIEEFNTNDEIFIFLLTTRVGGVGVNLIGANRIIIYDPDWNPSTDIQARERAWRIGQQRHVIIYRLLTAGTIEEKIYHRQVFKLYLTNRVLKDAKQKRFFKTNDMHELFTLGRDEKNIETKALFDDDLQIDEKSVAKARRKDKSNNKKRKLLSEANSREEIVGEKQPVLSEQKLQEMRERAKRISQMIANQYGGCANQPIGDTTNNSSSPSSSSLSSLRVITIKNEVLMHNDTSSQSNSFESLSNNELPSTSQSLDSENSLDLFSPIEAVPYCPARQQPQQAVAPPPPIVQSKSKKKSKQRVDYLVKQDIYKPGKTDQNSGNKDGDSDRYKRDDYILGRLFKNSNIYGALKHDKIESDSTADYRIVESEAEKVARDAIRALRESRRMCLGSMSGIPNWTGQNGQMASAATSGAGGSRPRLIPKNKARAQQLLNQRPTTSKATNGAGNNNNDDSILSSIRKRNQSNPIALGSSTSAAAGNNLDSDSDEDETNRDFHGKAKSMGVEDMAGKIREFILYRTNLNGEAATDELLEFFNRTFEPDKTAIFKAILNKMCDFQRRGKKGFWKLKNYL